jgi:DNA/RNA-binding domain of Phe-tRNA-synthetase-like protein
VPPRARRNLKQLPCRSPTLSWLRAMTDAVHPLNRRHVTASCLAYCVRAEISIVDRARIATNNPTSLFGLYVSQCLAVITFDLEHATLRLAVIVATNVRCEPSNAQLVERMHAAVVRVRDDAAAFPESVRVAVRSVLRVGGYKPTGRGKPASEFLLGVAREQELPIVNNLVDINNLVSLTSALPISMFDGDRLGPATSVRFGRPGESYVFNQSGQTMDIAGIPVVCRASSDEPVGNAVKDSMLAKVGQETRSAEAVIYGSRQLETGYLERAAQELANLMTEFASAETSVWQLIPG